MAPVALLVVLAFAATAAGQGFFHIPIQRVPVPHYTATVPYVRPPYSDDDNVDDAYRLALLRQRINFLRQFVGLPTRPDSGYEASSEPDVKNSGLSRADILLLRINLLRRTFGLPPLDSDEIAQGGPSVTDSADDTPRGGYGHVFPSGSDGEAATKEEESEEEASSPNAGSAESEEANPRRLLIVRTSHLEPASNEDGLKLVSRWSIFAIRKPGSGEASTTPEVVHDTSDEEDEKPTPRYWPKSTETSTAENDERTSAIDESDEWTTTTDLSDDSTTTTDRSDERTTTTDQSDEMTSTTNQSDDSTTTTDQSDEWTTTTKPSTWKPWFSTYPTPNTKPTTARPEVQTTPSGTITPSTTTVSRKPTTELYPTAQTTKPFSEEDDASESREELDTDYVQRRLDKNERYELNPMAVHI